MGLIVGEDTLKAGHGGDCKLFCVTGLREKAIAVGQGDAPADEIAKIEKQVAEWKSAKK
jgi:hypothetical protein